MGEFLIGIFMGILITFLIVGFVIDPDDIWQKKIVEAGHGQYNNTTGKFEFLEPCKAK